MQQNIQHRDTLRQYLQKYRARRNLLFSQNPLNKSRASYRSKSQTGKNSFKQHVEKMKQEILVAVVDHNVMRELLKHLDELQKIYEKDLNSKRLEQQILSQIQRRKNSTDLPTQLSRARVWKSQTSLKVPSEIDDPQMVSDCKYKPKYALIKGNKRFKPI